MLEIFYILIIFLTRLTLAANECLVIQAKSFYGTYTSESCLNIQVSEMANMTIHTISSIVGFTFTFINGTSQSYIENEGYTSNYTIELINISITGANIYIGNGIEGIQLQLFNSSSNESSLSPTIGQSIGCFSYFNSTSMNVKYLMIDSINGCIQQNNLTYFPYLFFSYSFSQCKFSRFLIEPPSISTEITMTTTMTSILVSVTPLTSLLATTTFKAIPSTSTLTSTISSTYPLCYNLIKSKINNLKLVN
jgi:hypothetical protein